MFHKDNLSPPVHAPIHVLSFLLLRALEVVWLYIHHAKRSRCYYYYYYNSHKISKQTKLCFILIFKDCWNSSQLQLKQSTTPNVLKCNRMLVELIKYVKGDAIISSNKRILKLLCNATAWKYLPSHVIVQLGFSLRTQYNFQFSCSRNVNIKPVCFLSIVYFCIVL
jgi:hypothetical protein